MIKRFTQDFRTISSSNLFRLKRVAIILFVVLGVLRFPASAQNSFNSGDGWGAGWGTGAAFSASAGSSLIYTTTNTLGGNVNRFFRFYGNGTPCGEYGPNGAVDVALAIGTEYNNTTLTCGSAKAFYLLVPNTTDYYIFKSAGVSSAQMVIFRTSAIPRTITALTQAPTSANVRPGQAVSVTATFSAALATGQAAYLRYTTDGWATSSVVAFTGTTATIPAAANKPGASISYYAFTSGTTPAPAANGSNADFYTINLNNNAGSNYSYTVASGWTTAAAGNWNVAATWGATSAPSATESMGAVTINHAVTQNVAVVASSVTINATGTLTATANTLTISNNTSGTTFTNSGTLALSGTSVIAFAGTGTHTVSGTAAFNNVSTNTGVNFDASSTINGTFTINAGGFVSTNAPTYGASSTLTYNTGAAYAAGTEWTANALTGQGVPQNVSLTTASTSVNFGASTQYRRLRGNLNIAVSTTLALSTASGGDLRIGGNFANSGTFNNSSRTVFFDGSATQTVSGTCVFFDVTASIGVNFGTASTINNNFTINSGGSVVTNAPTYGASSTLIYNTGAAFAAGAEWTANVLTGVGVPNNVSINTAATAVNFGAGTTYRRLRGNLSISASTSLTLSTAAGGNLRVGGNFTNNGTFTHNSRTVFFDGTAVQTVSGTTTFFDVTATNGVDFGTSSTINNNFTINAGGFVSVNPPTYGAASTLIYSTAATYTAGTEWTPNALSGQGVPQNVTISTAATNLSFGTSGQYRRMRGNLSISASTTLTLSTVFGGDLRIGGNWANLGTFVPNSRAVIFDGSAAQAISSGGVSFGFLLISNTSANVTASTPVTVAAGAAGGLTIDAGARLDMGANVLTITSSTAAINGFLRAAVALTGATAVTLSVNNGATYEHNHQGAIPLATWNSGSTCTVIGWGAGTTAPANLNQAFHHFTWNSTAQSATINLLGNPTTINGNFSVLSTGSGILRWGTQVTGATIAGNLIITSTTTNSTLQTNNSGTASTISVGGNVSITQTGSVATLAHAGTSTTTITFNRSSATPAQQFSSSGTISGPISWNAGTGSSTNVVQLASAVNLGTGTGIFTVAANATMDFQNFVFSGSGTFAAATGSTLLTANTAGINTSGATGSVQTTTRTFTNTGVNYNYNGTLAQAAGTALGAAASVGNLTINNAAGLSLSNNLQSLTGTLTFSSGSLTLGTFNLTLANTAAVSGAESNRYIITNSTGAVTRSSLTSAFTFPIGNASYNPITLTNTGTGDNYGVRVLSSTATPSSNNSLKIVNRYWEVTETVAGGGILAVTAQYNSGEPNSGFAAGTVLNMGYNDGTDWFIVPATGAGSGPFTASTNSSLLPVVALYTIGIGKDEGLVVPSYDFTWTGSTSSDWGTASNWDIGSVPANTDNIIIPTSTSYTNALNITGSRTCAAFSVSGDGTFSMAASSSINVKGNLNYSSTVAPSFHCSSTFQVSSSLSQTIPAFNYGNLNIAGGVRVLASSGSIGVCGSFTPAASQTVTGSTVNYFGTGAQSIAATSYNNLTISNARGGAAITLPAGTISVGGTFDISSLSGNSVSVNASSVFDFTSASAQTIPAFFYGQLNNTGNGNRTWASSGTIDINQGFSPGTGTHTITGSTVRYSNTAAATNSLVSFTTNVASRQYNNLIFAGGASTIWQIPGLTMGITGDLSISNGTFRLANGVTTTNNATFNIDGNLSISGGALDIAGGTTAIGTLNLSGDFSQTGGTISRSATTSTTSSINFIKSAGGVQAINQTGGSLLLTGMTLNAGNGTTTNTVRLNSNLVIGGTPGTSPVGFMRVQALAKLDFQTYNISGTGGFTTVGNSTLITANIDPSGALNAHPATTGSLQNGASTAQRVIASLTNVTFNGSSDQVIGNALSTVGDLTINTSGGAKVTLNTGASTALTVGTSATSQALILTSGVLFLSSGILYVYNDVQGAPFGPTKMIVTNQGSVFPQRNPGQLRRYFPTAAIGATQNVSMTFPLGDITGTADYTPMIVNLTYTAGASAVSSPYFGVKCIDARNPYDASLTDYMSRYYIISTGTAFNNATTVALDVKCAYKNDDVVGNEAALKMNRFSTGTLQNTEDLGSYTDASNDTLYSITLDKTMFTDHDIFGRKTVPLYFRSNASGKWQDVNNWLISSDINFVSPAGIVPPLPPNSANSDSISLLASHVITADTVFPPYTMDQVLIEGTLNVASGATMAIANGPASLDARVSGTFSVAGTQTQVAGSATRFENSGIYIHATPTLNAKIPTATWATGSECRVTGITNSLPDLTTLNQAFSDFTWACTGQSASLNLSGNLSNVGRDLKITNSGAFNLGLVAGTGSLSLNIGRNLEVSGGNLVLTTGAISPTVNVSGDVIVSSGILDLNSGSGSTANLNLTGNFAQSGGTVQRSSGTGVLNFVKPTGTQTISQTSGAITGAVTINLGDGSTTSNTVQLSTGLVNGTGTISSKSGATLDFQTNAISGSGTFSAAAGTTLKTANTSGFNTAGASGSVQTTTRVFSIAAVNYVFNGSSAQAGGTGLGASAINNLEINNASGLTLSAPLTINGTTTFTSGLIDLAASDVSLGASAAFIGQGSGKYFRTSGTGKLLQTVAATGKDFPVGNSAYNPIQFTNSGTSDVFGVRVLDATSSPAANNPSNIVNRYWLVTESVSGGSNLSVTAQYNSGEEASGFPSASNPVMGLYSSTAPLWKYATATSSGAGPFTFTSTLPAFTGTSYHIGLGKDDAFNCATPPAITSFTPTSAYSGETITLTGTGLTGLLSASIGGTAAVIASQSGTSATITVQEGSSGTILLTTSPGCGDFSAASLTYMGYKSAQTGNWGSASTWLGNFLPVDGKPVLIASGHNVTSNVAASPSAITVDSTATLTLSNAANLGSASMVATINGTLICPATVTNPANGIQAATLTINNGATFTNSAGNSNAVVVTTFNVNSGGTYNHDAISSSTNATSFDFPGATNNLNAAANINITKWGQTGSAPTAPFPTPASGTYGNLTINITTQSYTGAWNLQGGIPATNNFTICATGGREMRLFANSNTGTLNVNGNLSVTGGTVALINSNSANTGSATMNISGNMSISGGSFDMTGSGSPTSGNATVNLSGDLSITGGSLLRSTTNSTPGVSTFRFSKASGVQNFSSTSAGISTHPISWQVGNGSVSPVLNLNSNARIHSSATFTVRTGATLRCGTNAVSGTTAGSTGTFVLESGATLESGSADGISSSPSATGSVQTGTRTLNTAGNYIYNGTINQSTGNGLPSTITGSLGISNTGTSGSNTVTLTTNNTTVSTLNLSSGLFAAGSGQNINLASAGTVNATGGDFATGASAGTITAAGSAVFNGTSNPYNVYASGGVNFGAQTVTIQNGGTFRINSGGFVNTNAPFYATGSILEYSTGAPYDRGLEWSSASGRGAPHHVTVTSTTLNPAKTGATYASTAFNTLGDLTIASGGNIYMDYSSNNMTVPLNIAGNLNLTGNLSASNAVGGDVNLAGNWINNGTGANFFPNNRQVTFNGSSAQTIGGSNATSIPFEYLAITNSSGDVTTSRNITVNQRLQMNSGRLILGNNNLTLATAAVFDQGGANSYVVTNGTGTVTQHVSGSNEFFPVGPSISIYGPITLNQSGTADNISVRVSTAPAFTNAVNDNSKMVNLEWTLNEGAAGGNNLRTTFGWSGASEAASFDRSAGVFHGTHNGTRYVVRAADATTGSDPYSSLSTASQPYTGNLSSLRFVVGNIAGILPCLQTGAAGNWATASNWLNGIVPPAGSNVCISHAMSISSSVANPSGVTLETSGSISISNGSTLTLESPGTITNSSGSFVNMTTGSIAFSGLGIVNGSDAIGFNNLELNGNTTLSTTPTINGVLEIKAGGFLLNATGPNYGASSTLRYNTGGNYNRSNEWNASSGSGYPANVQIAGNTSLDISAGAAGIRQISGSMTIDAGSSLTQGSSNQGFIVPGNFTLNGSYTMSSAIGGDLVVSGNWSSGSSASLTHNNRDIRFDGSSAQNISVANGLQFGFLTIDNSGSGVNLLNPITVNTFRVNAGRSFSLFANKIIISAGGNLLINGTFDANSGTIEYTNGGSFTNNGTFDRGTSTLDFVGASAGVVTGSVQTNFHNIRLFPGGGVDFGSGALRGKVSGTLQLRAGSYVANNSPIYEPGAKLMYSGGGTFNRNVEWDPATVQKVEVTNNTTLVCGVNGTSFTHITADSVIVRSGSTLTMANGFNMFNPLRVGGHLLNDGTITLSGAIGGDLEVSGDFINNGTFNANDRAVTFNGSSDAGIKGSSNTIFHYMTVDKNAGKTLTATVPFSIGTLSSGSQMRIAGGTFDLNNQSLTFLSGSHTLRIDGGFAKAQTLKTGGTSITGFSSFSSNGSNSDTLGGKLNYSGSGPETMLTPVKGYNLLWITGASVKTIPQNTIVIDSALISTGSTLSFGAVNSTLEIGGNVVNNGTVSGSAGKILMKNTIGRSLSGSGSFHNLEVDNAAGIAVSGKPVISNSLTLTSGKMLTAADTIVLGSAATISETYSNGSYILGNLKTLRAVNTSANTFGGMGIELTAGANLGNVLAIRTSGDAGLLTGLPLSPDSSIRWNWTITPSVQPSTANRILTLRWAAQQDNNRNISALQIWKRSTQVDPWEEAGGIQTAGGNSFQRSVVWNNVNAFSQFTVGENNIPLALDLLSFTAVKEKQYARIEWQVADDSRAKMYHLEKSGDDGKTYSETESRSAGSVNGRYLAYDYRFYSDSYYRIRVTYLDGKEDVSKAVFLKASQSENTYKVYPNPAVSGKGIQISALMDDLDSAVHSIEVWSTDGKRLIAISGNLSDLGVQLEKMTSKLASGVYSLRIQNNDSAENIRFVLE